MLTDLYRRMACRLSKFEMVNDIAILITYQHPVSLALEVTNTTPFIYYSSDSRPISHQSTHTYHRRLFGLHQREPTDHNKSLVTAQITRCSRPRIGSMEATGVAERMMICCHSKAFSEMDVRLVPLAQPAFGEAMCPQSELRVAEFMLARQPAVSYSADHVKIGTSKL